MSVWRLLEFVGFLVACLTLGLTGLAVHWKMVEEVNARLDEKDRFELMGWHGPKSRRLVEQYRSLYPEGRLVRQAALLGGGLLLVMVLAVWQIGFGLGVACLVAIGGSVSLGLMYRA